MKRILACTFVMMLSVCAWSQEQELLSLPVGGNRTLVLAFNVQNYKMTPETGIIKVETIDGMDNKLRVIGLSIGECTLLLSGGGIQRSYRISVISNIAALLKRLREDFRDVTELDMAINQDIVVIKGTVSNHEKWQHVVSVLKRYDDKNIRNDARFWPNQAAIKDLRMSLETLGCKFTDEKDESKRNPGEIYMTMSGTAIVLAGREFTEDKLREILDCLKTFSWLAIKKEPSKELGQIPVLINIKTISDLEMTYRRLLRDFKDLKDLTIEKTQEFIDIHGTITSPKQWNYMHNILTSIGNQKLVRNFVEFSPSAETIMELEQSFMAAGYECVKTKEVKNGQLYIDISPSYLFLTAEVGSQAEEEEITAILRDQTWLAIGETPKHGQLRARLKISVVPTNIAIDVAFVALTSGDMDTLGSKGALTATFSASRLYDIVLGHSTEKSATFRGDMSKTLEFLSKNNITRSYRAGTVKFKNNATGEIVLGGTKFLMTREEVKEVNYGFRVNIHGSQINKRKVDLTFSLENSYMKDEDDKAEEKTSTNLVCDFGKTKMLGGFNTLTESISNEGFPYLRNIPVLKWFVSSDDNVKQDLKLIMLACPRICDEDEDIPIKIDIVEPQQLHHDSMRPLPEIKKEKQSIWKPNTWFRK